jgi:hypothetical protein
MARLKSRPFKSSHFSSFSKAPDSIGHIRGANPKDEDRRFSAACKAGLQMSAYGTDKSVPLSKASFFRALFLISSLYIGASRRPGSQHAAKT